MINLTLVNNKTKESIKVTYSVKDLISHGGEDLIIENIIENNVCHCSPVGETNVVECGCWEQWEDCTLIDEKVENHLSEGEWNVVQHALLYKTTDRKNSPKAQKQYEELLEKIQSLMS